MKKTSQFIRSPLPPLFPADLLRSYESLVELHRKTLNVDQFFDARLESTTLRSAWSEVRDNVEREAQTRRAFVDSMTHEVINPLISFKVSPACAPIRKSRQVPSRRPMIEFANASETT